VPVFMSLIVALFGCSELEAPDHGSLEVCLAGPQGTEPATTADLDLTGTVTAIDTEINHWNLDGCSGASSVLEITDDTGDVWAVGLSVSLNGEDHTPFFDVAEGDVLDLSFRVRTVWGTVSGFTLSSEDGLIAAVDEGNWGGALQPEDTPGLIVTRSEDPIHSQESDCKTFDTYTTTFAADDSIRLRPMETGAVEVEGLPFTALSVASYDYRDGNGNCHVSDLTGQTSWMIFR